MARSGRRSRSRREFVVNLEKRNRDDEGSFGAPAGASGNFSGVAVTVANAVPAAVATVRPTRPPSDDTDLDDLPF